MPSTPFPSSARLALVGDRSPHVQAHARLPEILDALDAPDRLAVDAYWIGTADVAHTNLTGFDGIWALPGSPFVDSEGALSAIRFARTHGVPFLGTCAGFQHMLLEFARNVCGLEVEHAEDGPGDHDALIRPMACSLMGEERVVHVERATRAAGVLGASPRTERYFCSYGLDPRFEPVLVAAGLVIAGRDDDGDVRLAELPEHPFYVGALFQPELSSTRAWVHPLIDAFVAAVRTHAGTAASVHADAT